MGIMRRVRMVMVLVGERGHRSRLETRAKTIFALAPRL